MDSTMSCFDRLDARAAQTGSLLCVGLDPRPEGLDLRAHSADHALFIWCARVIDATREVALAYKPNVAFFEAFGEDGHRALERVIKYIGDEIPVILDAKRGDIASTGAAYARAAYDHLGAGAITVSPYMGWETVEPFLRADRGVFVLCATSNPGAQTVQSAVIEAEGGARTLSELVAGWAAHPLVGLVVGATRPDQLERARALAPDAWILAPGVGAQGADLGDALSAGLREDGAGLLINVSRGISQAADPEAAARALCLEIQAVREQLRRADAPAQLLPTRLAGLAERLVTSGCVRFGDFELKSGARSPIYIDLRLLVSDPALLGEAARAMVDAARDAKLAYDRLAALPYAALPIGTAMSLIDRTPLIYPRKEVKAYGTRAAIEGAYAPGERALMVDDLVSSGGSKIEAAEKLRSAGLVVEDVVVLIDRRSPGAAAELDAHNLRVHAALRLVDLLAFWHDRGLITDAQHASARALLDGAEG